MLTQAENEALTSIGPGTLMGNLMRQYWIPTLKSEELPHNDCAPVRVKLLGERLVAFRDSSGEIGLLLEACPHRGASLFLGRNEAGGLRCAYHGWKFDVRGECVDMACDPEHRNVRPKVRQVAYKCRERGGIVWSYLGPREDPPPLPELEMNTDSGAGRVDLMMLECNWLQNLEGDVDVDHIPVLHGGNLEAFRAVLRGEHSENHRVHECTLSGVRPFSRRRIEVMEAAAGLTYACNVSEPSRVSAAAEDVPSIWLVGQFMLPFFAMLPYGAFGGHWVVARVPMDDHHTMTFGMHSRNSPVPSRELMFGPEPAYLPNGPSWFERFRLSRNLDNDFGLDRSGLARDGSGSSIQGQAVQDAAVAQSMGTIVDRSREHLGPGDAIVVKLRRTLLSAARASERGLTPAGVDAPAAYRVKQGLLRARSGRSWQEEVEFLCKTSTEK